MTLVVEQQQTRERVHTFVENPYKPAILVDGPAGTGKSYLMAVLARELDAATLAPTGKAASIQRQRTGLLTRTIHNYVYDPPEIRKHESGARELLWTSAYAQNALAGSVVLVDEAGMVGQQLMRDLLNTGAVVIGFGDLQQLRPVNQEPYFTAGDLKLTQIHRQALDSPIIRQAHRVREGGPYENDTADFRVTRHATNDDVRRSDIMLCFTNKRRHALNRHARMLHGYSMPEPQVGEPLMCLKNNPRHGVYRGGIYRLLEPFHVGDTSISVDVDGVARTIRKAKFVGVPNDLNDEWVIGFEYGYCCTVHSAAGSEWDDVLLFDDFYSDSEDERRRWTYTGITRAAKRITIAGAR